MPECKAHEMHLGRMGEISISMDDMSNRQCYDLRWMARLELKELKYLGKCGWMQDCMRRTLCGRNRCKQG